MKYLSFLLVACLAMACTSVTHTSFATAAAADHPEARPFDPAPSIDAQKVVDEALAEAAVTGKYAMIVMGADWCHDSRALAGWFETPRFEALLRENYVVRYVDVAQKNRNIDVAQRFGLNEIVGTPTVFVTDSQGRVLNFDTAPTWRNAASRSEDDIYAYFMSFASQEK